MTRAAFAVLLAALLPACNQGPGAAVQGPGTPGAVNADASLDAPFVLRAGERAIVAGEGLTVSFQGVPTDSRCPTGVQCVWAGNAVVRAVLSRDGKAFGAELNTTLEPRSVGYLDYDVALVSLVPAPVNEGGAIPQSQYRATFMVTRTAP